MTSFWLITGLKAPGHVTSPDERKNADRLDWHLPERYFKNTTVHYLYMGVTIVQANVRSCRCVCMYLLKRIDKYSYLVVVTMLRLLEYTISGIHFFRIVIRRYFYLLQLTIVNSMPWLIEYQLVKPLFPRRIWNKLRSWKSPKIVLDTSSVKLFHEYRT